MGQKEQRAQGRRACNTTHLLWTWETSLIPVSFHVKQLHAFFRARAGPDMTVPVPEDRVLCPSARSGAVRCSLAVMRGHVMIGPARLLAFYAALHWFFAGRVSLGPLCPIDESTPLRKSARCAGINHADNGSSTQEKPGLISLDAEDSRQSSLLSPVPSPCRATRWLRQCWIVAGPPPVYRRTSGIFTFSVSPRLGAARHSVRVLIDRKASDKLSAHHAHG